MEEASKQQNMEDITNQAIPLLKEDTDAGNMDDDWVTNFFDKSRIVSDKDMQKLWAQVLAGEANAPGTYSKRTVNYLGDLDKSDADMFTKLCRFGWIMDDVFCPLIFNTEENIYIDNGITFDALIHLDGINLIQFRSPSMFVKTKLPKELYFMYYGQALLLKMPNDKDNALNMGRVLNMGHVTLTQVGQELAPICGSKPVDGFFDYVKERWKEYNPVPVSGKPGVAQK